MKPLRCAALTLLLWSPVAAADVATDANIDHVPELYFLDGTVVVRARCDRDTILYDRVHCQKARREAPFAALYTEVRKAWGADLDKFETGARELVVKIQEIDLKVLEMIDQSGQTPAAETAALKEQAEELQAELGPIDGKINEYRDQIVRIEDELRRGEDPGLQAQLAQLREALKAEEAKQRDLLERLAGVRKRIGDLNAALLDPAVFRALQDRRAQLVSQRRDALRGVDDELGERIDMDRAFKLLADQGFSWDVLSSAPNPTPNAWNVMQTLDKAFKDVFLKLNTFTSGAEQPNLVWDWDSPGHRLGYTLNVYVSNGQRLSALRCEIGGTSCDLTVTAPSGASAQLFNYGGRSFNTFRDVYRDTDPSDARDRVIFGSRAQGSWAFKAWCTNMGNVYNITCTYTVD